MSSIRSSVRRTKTQCLNIIRRLFAKPSIEKVLIRYSIHKEAHATIAKILPPHHLYKKGTIRIGNRHGFNFKMDISDLVDWHLYFGIRESAHEALYAICKSHFTVFDVGTNNGAVLMQLSKVANKGFVYGFEPDPTNYQRCLTNLSLNTITNVHVSNLAFGSNDGKGFLTIVDEHNRGMNKIDAAASDGICTEIRTIDSFVLNNNIEALDLIKIDTEGFEMHVLKGAEKAIRRFMPVLFIEIDEKNLREQNHSAKALIRFLNQLGYNVTAVHNKKIVTENDDFNHCHFDIIAAR